MRAIAEVRARAEVFARRRKHGCTTSLVLVECIESVPERIDQIHVEKVVRRSLDLDERDMSRQRDLDVPVFHVFLPIS